MRSDAGVADWRRRRSGWHLVARSRGQARISDGRVEKDVKVQDADGTAAVGRRMLRDVKERLLGGDGASGLHREEPRYPRGSFRRRVERSSRPPRRRCCCGRKRGVSCRPRRAGTKAAQFRPCRASPRGRSWLLHRLAKGAVSTPPAAALPRLLRSSSGVQAGASRSTGKAALSTAECRVQAKAAARRAAGAAVVLLSSRMEGVTPPRDTAWAMPEERADRPATLLFWFDGGVVAGR